MVAASDWSDMAFPFSGAQTHDAPKRRAMLERWEKPITKASLAMDHACEATEKIL